MPASENKPSEMISYSVVIIGEVVIMAAPTLLQVSVLASFPGLPLGHGEKN